MRRSSVTLFTRIAILIIAYIIGDTLGWVTNQILINYIDPKYLWKIPGIINYVFPLAFIILAINLPLIPSENQIGSLQREEEMARMSPLKLNQLDAPENDDKKE
jgi:hypothetical protein